MPDGRLPCRWASVVMSRSACCAGQQASAADGGTESPHRIWASGPEVVKRVLIGIVTADRRDPAVVDRHQLAAGDVQAIAAALGGAGGMATTWSVPTATSISLAL